MTTKIFRSKLITILASHQVAYTITAEGVKIQNWDSVPDAVKILLRPSLLAADAVILEEGEEIPVS